MFAFRASVVLCASRAKLAAMRAKRQHLRQRAQREAAKVPVNFICSNKDAPFLVKARDAVSYQEIRDDELAQTLQAVELAHRERAARRTPPIMMHADAQDPPPPTDHEHAAEVVRRAVALDASSSKAHLHALITVAVEHFGRSDGDTGSPETQAAVQTLKILALERHYTTHKKDFNARRRLKEMVQSRQTMLRYLRREDGERYFRTIADLGVDDASVLQECTL